LKFLENNFFIFVDKIDKFSAYDRLHFALTIPLNGLVTSQVERSAGEQGLVDHPPPAYHQNPAILYFTHNKRWL